MRAESAGPVRRVVTGHSEQGKAVVISDQEFDPVVVPSGDAAMVLLWATGPFPVDNTDPTDGRERAAGLTLEAGSVIRTVDMLPGQSSPMHRTSSIDYGIVLSGRVELELDDGAVTELSAGDVVIQRGTMHRWRNPSDTEPCRIVFALVEADPARVDGEPLEAVHP